MRSDNRALMRATLTLAAAAALACKGGQDERKPGEFAAPSTPRDGVQTVDSNRAPRPTTSVDEVRERPDQFDGKQVRVAGTVDKLLSERAFELEGTGWAFHDNIVVLTKSPVQLAGVALAGSDELVVTGTVRPFVAAEVSRDLGWDMTPEIEVRLKERPVLIADTIRRISDEGAWRSDVAVEGAPTPVTSLVAIVTALDLHALAGRQVDLGREKVLAVEGKGLWVGPSVMSQIFVVPTVTPKDIKVGDMVRVSGTLRAPPKDAATVWGLSKETAARVEGDVLYLDDAVLTLLPGGARRPDTQTPAATHTE